MWLSILLILLVAVWLFLPRLGWMRFDKAVEALRSGGVLVDVRTPAEYATDRIKGAENIPLSELEEGVRRAGCKADRPVLLYCASGMRSGTARRRLKALGFAEAGNLGSFARARKIVDAAGHPASSPES
ncbi:MAG: rhodanese-like domain-containing protein [Oceanipulchritudo sp.]